MKQHYTTRTIRISKKILIFRENFPSKTVKYVTIKWSNVPQEVVYRRQQGVSGVYIGIP